MGRPISNRIISLHTPSTAVCMSPEGSHPFLLLILEEFDDIDAYFWGASILLYLLGHLIGILSGQTDPSGSTSIFRSETRHFLGCSEVFACRDPQND